MKSSLLIAFSLLILLCILNERDAFAQGFMVYKKARILPPMLAPAKRAYEEYGPEGGRDEEVEPFSTEQFGGYMKRYNPYPLPPFLLGRTRSNVKNFQRRTREAPNTFPILKRYWINRYE